MTTILSKKAYESARGFLLTRARKLEAALFIHEFEGGSVDRVYAELETFLNEDGGFGRGLEPDLRCDASSVLATTTGLQLLLAMSERNEAIIGRNMRYLVGAYIESRQGWDIIPPAATEAPRAIWWEYGAFSGHWGNPNAEIVGYLNQFPEAGSVEWISGLNARAVQYLRDESELNEMHEMLCYLRWAETIPEEVRSSISGRLDEFVGNCVIRNSEDRGGYGAYPLLIVNSPKSRYYSSFEDIIPGDLDQLIGEQGEDGAWSPNWSWGRYDDEWETAKVELQGIHTLNALRTLRNFGRLE
jgi:hypothetical protein